MPNGKSFFIDQTRCTACRACQVACKEWKNMPVETTVQTGTYQNPPDLSATTFKLVRFIETREDGKLKWLFFPEQCRHCVEPPCKMAGDLAIPNAIQQDPDTGAVLYTDETKKLDKEEIRNSCPYDIPRHDPATGKMTKCNMCIDRVRNGLLPACVKVCPTGCMNFGERDAMLELANKRLAEVKKKAPKALLVDADTVRTIFLCETDPKIYSKNMAAELAPRPDPSPTLLSRRELFGRLVNRA